MDLIHGILGRLATHQSQKQNSGSRPLFVWEPIPDLCIPENVNSFRQAIQQVDIVSPNVEELSGFFTEKNKSKAHMAAEVLKWGIGPDGNGALVIREGKDGCSAFLRAHQTHLKAYHTPAQESQARVVDPTGGGNAFLGALAMAWTGSVRPLVDETRRLLASQASSTEPFDHLTICLIYATVAASFVIEQPGMPTHGTELDGRETWNGEHFEDRLRAYLSREEAFFTQQMRHSKKKKN